MGEEHRSGDERLPARARALGGGRGMTSDGNPRGPDLELDHMPLTTKHADFSVKADRVDRDTAVVTVTGEVDLVVAPELLECLDTVIDAGRRRIAVDMTAVRFIDSTAIGALLTA